SEGLGLGHDFLRHIERCRMLVQVVDISCSEGRPAVTDFETIAAELEKFSPELAARPRIVVANKADLLVDAESEFIEIPEMSEEAAALELRCAELGYELYYISAAKKLGLKDLVDAIADQLRTLPPTLTYETEITPEDIEVNTDGAEDVTISRGDDAVFVVEGRWADALIDRINFNDRESMLYFENSLVKCGIINKLRDAGCEEGDTVRIAGFEFDFID
ncbi:MAG: Obg family GTPase CgtA, partial [Clostridia bacterium]|nr:Obg family GTPase CgtA [Clostridia bacterium]